MNYHFMMTKDFITCKILILLTSLDNPENTSQMDFPVIDHAVTEMDS